MGNIIDTVCKVLVREPYNFSYKRIGKLTDYQILQHLLVSQEEEGGGESSGDLASVVNAIRAEKGLPPVRFIDSEQWSDQQN